MTDSRILTFDNTKKKPRKIEPTLPWPPSAGLVKEMEQGLVTEATFEIHLRTSGGGKSHEEVMKDLESKRRL